MQVNSRSLSQAVDALVSQVIPFIEDGESGQRTTLVAVLKYLRPYIEASIMAHAPGRVKGVTDRRLQKWRVHVEVYESDVEIYATPGRIVSPYNRDDVLEFGGDVYHGLDGFADWLSGEMLHIGAPEKVFGVAHVRKVMHGLRPSLGRGGAVKFSLATLEGRWKILGQIKRDALTEP